MARAGIALLTSFFFYPLGLVLGVASLVVGVRARRAAREGGDGAPGALPRYRPRLGRPRPSVCRSHDAVPVVGAQRLPGLPQHLQHAKPNGQACQDEYYPKIVEKLGLPEGSMKKYGDIL